MKLVILAGGRGTRLGLTDRPKPMVELLGRPLLERQIEVARGCGFIDIVLLTGHLAEVIESHFGDGSAFGVRIAHVRETAPLGTAGAVRAARALLAEPFILLYGDLLLDVDLAHMAGAHARFGGVATLFVHPNDHPHDSDLVVTDGGGRVTAFLSKPHADGALLPNLVNGAVYVLDPATIDFVPDRGASDWGHDVFPAMLAAGQSVHAYRSLEYVKDVGTPARLAKGEADLRSGRVARLSRRFPKPAIFLDRDGVLNREVGGVRSVDEMTVDDGVGAALRTINASGVPAICVTNQPGIAKGQISVEGLEQIHRVLQTRLGEDGAYLDDLLYCPHHPEGGWPGEVAALKIACDCRKPAPGLLLAAAARHNLDLSRSWLIGDRYADVAAGHRAGARTILLRRGHAGNDVAGFDETPDFVAGDLAEAAALALGTLA